MRERQCKSGERFLNVNRSKDRCGIFSEAVFFLKNVACTSLSECKIEMMTRYCVEMKAFVCS